MDDLQMCFIDGIVVGIFIATAVWAYITSVDKDS